MLFENNKLTFEKIRNSFDKNRFTHEKNKGSFDKNNFLQSSQFIQATNIIQKQLLQKYTSDIILNRAQSTSNTNPQGLSQSSSNQAIKQLHTLTKSSIVSTEIDQEKLLKIQQPDQQTEQQSEKQIKIQPFLSHRRQQTCLGEYQDNYYIKSLNQNKFTSRNKGSTYSKTLSHSLDKRILPTIQQNVSQDIQQNNQNKLSPQLETVQMYSNQQIEEINLPLPNMNNLREQKQIQQLKQENLKRNSTSTIKIPQKQLQQINDYRNYLREVTYNQQNSQQAQKQLNVLNDFIQSRSYKLIQNQYIQSTQSLRNSINKNEYQVQPNQYKYLRETSTTQIPFNKHTREGSLPQFNQNNEDKYKYRSLTNANNQQHGQNYLEASIQQNIDDSHDEQFKDTTTIRYENKQSDKYEDNEQKQISLQLFQKPITLNNQIQKQKPLDHYYYSNQDLTSSTGKYSNKYNSSNFTNSIQNENTKNQKNTSQNFQSLSESTKQQFKNRLNDFFNRQLLAGQENYSSKDQMSQRLKQNIPDSSIFQKYNFLKQIKEKNQLQSEMPISKSQLFLQNLNLKSQLQNKSQLTQKQNKLQESQLNAQVQILNKKSSVKKQNNEDDQLQPWESNHHQDIYESSYVEDISNQSEEENNEMLTTDFKQSS